MASLTAVQASVDLALECALRDIVQKAASLLSEGRRVSDADIAMLFLDEAFLDLTQNVMAVLDDLEWATGEGFEEDDALRHRAEVQVDVALGVAEQEAWETLKDLFDQHVVAPPAATLERLSRVFVLLRTSVAAVVEAADTPRSTPNDSEEDADEEDDLMYEGVDMATYTTRVPSDDDTLTEFTAVSSPVSAEGDRMSGIAPTVIDVDSSEAE